MPKSSVLFLIRTYSGHLNSNNHFNLQFALDSLKLLENPNWMALLFCTDLDPIDFQEYTKQDIRILAYHGRSRMYYDEWTAGYDITDRVLDYLESSKLDLKYIVITNGDNYYSPQFLNELPSPDDVDIVAVDYWSRYQREGYNLNPLNMTLSICHEALVRVGMVDLGGVLLNYQRFQREHQRFMKFGPINSQDGYMFQLLVQSGWKIKYIRKCLFGHSPNPYMCSQQGGVWWDSPISRKELSDGCMNDEQRQKKKSELPIIELVSSTGIKYWTVPEQLKRKRQKLADAENLKFIKIFTMKLRKARKSICQSLKDSGFQPDPQSYATLNSDLASVLKTDKDLINHFWNDGCYKRRPIGNVDMSYYG